MGAPSYCHKCGYPMRWATAREVQEGHQECGSCGSPNPCNRNFADILEEMQEKMDWLERQIDFIIPTTATANS